MSRVGEKIKGIRTELKISQKQLAKKLGVAEKFINDIELGRKVANQSLIDRITKIFGKNVNDITMSFEEEVFKESKEQKYVEKAKDKKATEVWSDAFNSVLKNIPVYKYNMNKQVASKQLPIIGNKVEGYAQDKVLYLEIEDDDMVGFRIAKGDIALGHITHEVENNSICLVEYGNERKIRQIKRLDNNKVLLVSNSVSLRTETIEVKDLKVLVRLDRLEIKL